MSSKTNLGDILSGKTLEIHADAPSSRSNTPEPSVNKRKEGFCVECEDQPADLYCEQCNDDFCSVCYGAQHRKGTRTRHQTKKIDNALLDVQSVQVNGNTEEIKDSGIDVSKDNIEVSIPSVKGDIGSWFIERSKYIPVRLSLTERKYLRLLEAALDVSEYTDKIDILTYSSKPKRIVAQIKELCSILSGLVLAADYKAGQELFENKEFHENQEFFQKVFELGRRHKIMNPEKMRNTYGKLIYMLMDSQIPEVEEMLEFSCITDIKTVYKVLSESDGLKVLQDDLIVPATQEIIPSGKTRSQIQREIKQKEYAIEKLAAKYATEKLSQETIKQCLYSIGDNHAFLRTNRDPCDHMIQYLKRFFKPDEAERGFSLSIQVGSEGARLSHSHEKQYHYVFQSLSLWREVQHEMFQLWYLAEQDLLSRDNYYRLRDTGQGLNRVQSAPGVYRLMHNILSRAQQKVGYWVGSSVIHLGDHNVPNAFMFIDKYTQIYRFLLPITTVLEKLDDVARKDAAINTYIETRFGGVEAAKKRILCDFFRHGFDGSGADNYFDAGSCIDGRLTSAWNWCSTVEKKDYFPLFLLTGFVGFDGQF